MGPATKEDWKGAAGRLEMHRQALIDGEFVDAVTGETFAVIDPANGRLLADVASCDVADVDRAVASARAAFARGDWSRSAPADRKAVLRRFAELIAANQEELALLTTLEMGKPIGDSLGIELPLAASVMEWQAEAIDKAYGEVAPTGPGDLALITREPLGVVAAIVPWNFPVNLAISRIAPALAAGNSVILKPAEQTPLAALRIGELGLEAGLPPGVLNVVPGIGELAGKALALHMDVDCVAFTGSTAVGKLLLTFAGQSNMKQVFLECGGKSANLVFADCTDLNQAADMAAMGAFWNQGEVCSSHSRLLVEESIAEELVELVAARARAMSVGDPLDPATQVGPLVDGDQAGKVLDYIESGRGCARLVTGGGRADVGGSDHFVEPTIFDRVPSEAPIAQEEIFGPVLSVLTFGSEEEAIRIANGTAYGLGASIWTADLSRALRVSRALRAGTVSVNTVDAYSVLTPFGGVGDSGSSRDHSLHAIEHYTSLKTTWIKY
jgi:gamma-glutamyl-gamma-aminobutyraldehyde dehydrogenase